MMRVLKRGRIVIPFIILLLTIFLVSINFVNAANHVIIQGGNLSLSEGDADITGTIDISGLGTFNGDPISIITSKDMYVGGDLDITLSLNVVGTGTFGGALSSTTLNTGQGAYELYAMDQNVLTTSNPTFASLDTGSGAMNLGDAAIINDDDDSIPTSNQVYDFVIGQSYMSNLTDNWVNESGDNMTGNLNMTGTDANIALNSNYLSGDGDDEGICVDSDGNVGIGTNSPSKKIEISDGSKGITFDPTDSVPTINTTGTSNLTITSVGGSVIIKLG